MSALLPHVLWKEIEPLLPQQTASPKGGRPPVSNRACLTGILFILKSGLPWNMLPQELGCGSGVTCWRRLQEWTQAEVWPELHRRLLRRLGKRGSIRLSRAVIDSASVRAVLGGVTLDPIPRIAPKKAVRGM
jgi:transposase